MNASAYTFLILAITIVLFIWGKIRSDLVAIISLLALFVGGILTTSDTLSGFSDSTVIMIAALFVVGEGLSRTGVTSWLSHQIIAFAGQNPIRVLIVLMAGTALLSAFISNTGTVATLLPAVVAISWSIGSLPSKLLIPLAFAANTGGLLTLTGTPPNIVVSDTLSSAGYEAFGYFEYAYIGVPLLLVAIVYMVTVGQRLLPARETTDRPDDLESSMEDMADTFALEGKLFLAYINPGSTLVNKTLAESGLGRDYTISVLRIDQADPDTMPSLSRRQRRRQRILQQVDDLTPEEDIPSAKSEIQAHDILTMKGSSTHIKQAAHDFNFEIEPINVGEAELSDILVTSEIGVAEVLITARSVYIGRTVNSTNFSEKFGVQVLSIRRGDKLVTRRDTNLKFGDALFVRGSWDNIDVLRNERRNFTVVGSPDDLARQVVELNSRAIIAVLALVGMVVMMAFNIVPSVFAALIAAAVMVLGNCLDMNHAYRAISWQSVVLIAAMIPMSVALQKTGGAELIANGLVSSLGSFGPLALMAGVFLLTTAFSQVINNTATAVLVAPIVLQAAEVSGISPYPLLMVVAISASTAFLTPIGTTTNLMVMTPAGYNFNDYIKVGLPLMILFLLVSLILVPLIWPFYN
ncbi:MAG: SLC13 family permease [Chloroflexi bacterium]|nr:MAG: SLC13 family permease [Chloroflexota bacterium]PIE81053.1 MAG: SLC13 family permease [Chloroflexota bacterium]